MVVATPCAGETAVSPPPVPHGRGHPVARRVRTRHDGAMDDSGGGAYSRNETASERLDRNWNEILQETRVTQTGIQILTGFLLTVPFQQRFTELTEQQRMFYLGLVLLAAVTTGLVVAPVSLHRWLFRRRAKDQLVTSADRFLRAGLVCLSLVVSGVVLLVFDVAAGRTAATVAAAVVFAVLVTAWFVVPLALHRRKR